MKQLTVRILGREVLAIDLGVPKPMVDDRPTLMARASLQDGQRAGQQQTRLTVGFTPTRRTRG